MPALPPRIAIIACGALARELTALNCQLATPWAVHCLPPELHNQPARIPQTVRARIEELRPEYDQIVVGYADCGTGGQLDAVCDELGVSRLPGAHCYELFAGTEQFAAWHAAEPGTFYLTDYLARNFDRLVIDGLGLRTHPQLLATYFGNYRRVMYLQQRHESHLLAKANEAAAFLDLPLQVVPTGLHALASSLGDTMRVRLPVMA